MSQQVYCVPCWSSYSCCYHPWRLCGLLVYLILGTPRVETKGVSLHVVHMYRVVVIVGVAAIVAPLVLRKVLLAYTVNRSLHFFSVFACVLWLLFISACQSEAPNNHSYRVVDSGYMKFEDLFIPVDTIRFAPSVLVGNRSFVDLSDQGEFLVTDDVMRKIHLFTASGLHIRSLKISQCNPEDTGLLLSTRFLGNGSMIATTINGVYVLDSDGSCKQRLMELPPNCPSFCERQDTVYFLDQFVQPPQVLALSIESGIVRNYDLRTPEFPRTTSIKKGYTGRQIACFDHGIFYRYSESSDGELLRPSSNQVMHQPVSYRPPRRDLTSWGSERMRELRELSREFTYSDGIFELDASYRMVTFQYPSDPNVNIINMTTETSISTSTGRFIMLAKNGLLYVSGDYERLPSGETGNRTLEVWKFQPFESSSYTD